MKTFITVPVVAALALVAITGLAGAAPNHADEDGNRCDTSGSSQVFESFGDKRNYVLAPDGSFEAAGDGWTLEGGAVALEGGAPFLAEDPGQALSLPNGASAISPEICVQKGMPLARMFATGVGEGKSKLRVDVLFKEKRGAVSRAGGGVSPGEEWDATRKFSLAQGKASKGGTVQLQFTAKRGDSMLDGVYIDPRARH